MNEAIKNIKLTDRAETILLALGEFTMLGEYDEPYSWESIKAYAGFSEKTFQNTALALINLGFLNFDDGNLNLTKNGRDYIQMIHQQYQN